MFLVDYVDYLYYFGRRLFGLVLLFVLLLLSCLIFINVCPLWVSRGLECLVLEAESFFIVLDSEADLGTACRDDSLGGVQEWSSQNNGQSLISSCLNHHKICKHV